MSDLRWRIDRKLWDAGTRRFAREIGVSVLATVIGGAVISYATREVPAPVAPAPKSYDRLASNPLPEPVAAIRDTQVLVSPPVIGATQVTATPVAQASTSVIPVRMATRPIETAPRRVTTIAALPPVRPAERMTLADADLAPLTREASTREPSTRDPLRIFGWSVPGSDLIPTGAEAAQTVSELGRQVGQQVASVGGAIGERVGLR